MKGRIISDWERLNPDSPQDVVKMWGALQAFLLAPDIDKDVQKFRAAIQAFGYKGDFPAEILPVLDRFNQTPYYDMGYELIFDIRDFTGTNLSGFDILDVSSGLSFQLVKPGGKAKVYKMSGAKVSVSFDLYGGGLSWNRLLLDDKQYWTLEDNAIQFRNVAYQSRAQDYYDLVEAVGATYDTAWQAVDGSVPNTSEAYIPIRDSNTINAACLGILTRLKDLGMGANTQSTFIILAPEALRARINRALAYYQQAMAGSPNRVVYNIQPVFSLMLTNTTDYYVIFPKGKLKGGYRMNLTLMGNTDVLSYSDTTVGWMRYGGAIAETKQLSRCKTS